MNTDIGVGSGKKINVVRVGVKGSDNQFFGDDEDGFIEGEWESFMENGLPKGSRANTKRQGKRRSEANNRNPQQHRQDQPLRGERQARERIPLPQDGRSTARPRPTPTARPARDRGEKWSHQSGYRPLRWCRESSGSMKFERCSQPGGPGTPITCTPTTNCTPTQGRTPRRGREHTQRGEWRRSRPTQWCRQSGSGQPERCQRYHSRTVCRTSRTCGSSETAPRRRRMPNDVEVQERWTQGTNGPRRSWTRMWSRQNVWQGMRRLSRLREREEPKSTESRMGQKLNGTESKRDQKPTEKPRRKIG